MHLMYRAGEIGDGLCQSSMGESLTMTVGALASSISFRSAHPACNRQSRRYASMIVTAGRIEEDHGDSAKRVKHCC